MVTKTKNFDGHQTLNIFQNFVKQNVCFSLPPACQSKNAGWTYFMRAPDSTSCTLCAYLAAGIRFVASV